MLNPINKFLIVKPLEKQETKLGNIIIPETANAELTSGEVISVSNDINTVNTGDIVIFPTGSGRGWHYNGLWVIWLAEHELWAVEKPSNENTI